MILSTGPVIGVRSRSAITRERAGRTGFTSLALSLSFSRMRACRSALSPFGIFRRCIESVFLVHDDARVFFSPLEMRAKRRDFFGGWRRHARGSGEVKLVLRG